MSSTHRDSMADGKGAPAIVVLVHGTWGRGVLPWWRRPVAAWCDEDSEIRRVCKAVLGETTRFVPFPWSGANSPKARLDASKDLKDRLEELRAECPSTPLFLVTHSHGGNVAMYSMQDAGARREVAGLVCFSTPFLHVRVRELGKSARVVEKSVSWLTIVMLVVAALVATAVLLQYLASRQSEEITFLAGLGGALILMLALLVLLKLLSFSQAWRRWTRKLDLTIRFRELDSWSRNLAVKHTLPSELPFPVLLVRDAGDEASSALAGPQFVSSLFSGLLNVVVAVLRGVKAVWDWASAIEPPNVLKWFAITVGSFIALLAVLGLFDKDLDDLPGWLVAPIFIPYLAVLLRGWTKYLVLIVAIVLGIPCFVIVYLLVLVLSSLLVPFGLEFAASGAVLKITAEATPPGEWNVVQLGPGDPSDSDAGMQHSTHSRPEALRIVQRWLSATVTGMNEGV